MTATHTPGPWAITLDAMDTFVSSADGKTICEIAHSRDFSNPAKECVANARLIAAAPDLLDALDALTITILQNCCEDDYANMHGLKKYVERARAAIAKARGEG